MQRSKCFLLVTALLIITASGCAADHPTSSSGKYKIYIPPVPGVVPAVRFELDHSLLNLPMSAPVYSMVKPDVTLEYVKTLGAKFGLTGEVTEGSENFLIGEAETRTYLEVYKASGTFRFTSYSKLYPDTTPGLPSNDEALKIATDFLVERGLLPQGDVASSVDVGGRTNGVPSHLLVNFTHVIQLTGPGARHGVRIGDKGEVIEVFINPTNPLNLPVYETVSLKTLEQAFKDMKSENNYSIPTGTAAVHLDSVGVAYWLEPIDTEQQYVFPVLIFRGRCLDANGNQLSESFSGVVEAVR
jgi:hypothetical protein